MATGKKSFIAYSDWKEMFDSLPDEVAGKLIKHIFAYVNDDEPSTNDYIINALFANVKNTLKRDLAKWDKQREQRIEAGKKSAKVRATKSNERSNSLNEKARNSTVSVSDSVNVSDSVSVIDNTSLDENKFSPEIRKLSELLFTLIFENNEKAKKPNYDMWDSHIEKLHRIDGYELRQIEYVIKWCQQDSFWKSNILSTKKLREKFGSLVVKIKSEKEKKVAPKKESYFEKFGFGTEINNQKMIG